MISIPVHVDPLHEQERIVAAIEEQFSRIDAGVAALEKVGRNLSRMRASVLQAAVLGQLDVEPADTEPVKLSAKPPPAMHRGGRLWGSGSVPLLTADGRSSIP